MLLGWEADAQRELGPCRAALGDHVGEAAWKDLIDELLEVSPEFRQDVGAARGFRSHRPGQEAAPLSNRRAYCVLSRRISPSPINLEPG